MFDYLSLTEVIQLQMCFLSTKLTPDHIIRMLQNNCQFHEHLECAKRTGVAKSSVKHGFNSDFCAH
jgi:hypothetical protein